MYKKNKGYVIYFVIFLMLLILSFININKIISFSNILGSLYNLSGLGVVIYFIALILGFIYYLTMLLSIGLIKIDLSFVDKLNKLMDIPLFVIKCITFIFFIIIFITTPCTVVGSSMEPTFSSGDKVLSLNIFNDYKRGDVVVFSSDEYMHDNSFYIKRVVASEGDFIIYDNTQSILFINDEVEKNITGNEYYHIVKSLDLNVDDVVDTGFYVPKGKLLVFGDNRSVSQDSRAFGFINEYSVYGEVYFRFYPFNKIKLI